MFETKIKPGSSRHGLAGLLASLHAAPSPEPTFLPEPDPKMVRAAEDEVLRATAFAEGRAEGQAEAEAALAPALARLQEAASAFEAACRIDTEGLRPALAELVRGLCERVLMAELAASPAALLQLADAALAQLKPGEPAVLHAAPHVISTLNDHAADALGGLQLEADPSLGDVIRLTGPTFIIEAGLDARLEAELAALEGRA